MHLFKNPASICIHNLLYLHILLFFDCFELVVHTGAANQVPNYLLIIQPQLNHRLIVCMENVVVTAAPMESKI